MEDKRSITIGRQTVAGFIGTHLSSVVDNWQVAENKWQLLAKWVVYAIILPCLQIDDYRITNPSPIPVSLNELICSESVDQSLYS